MNGQTDWWQDFFNGLVVDFWRAVMTPEITRAEADSFEKFLLSPPGGGLLDVPCGDGRLALELAARGYRLTGVDISLDFLAAARQSAHQRGLSIEWQQGDMRDLPWKEEFDGAFCAGSSFGFLEDEGDAAFLRAVCRALKPGGRFILDSVKAAEVILPNFRERFEAQAGGLRFVGENRYDHETGRTENRYTISGNGKTETRTAWHRIYTYREVVRFLESSGFGRVISYGSLSGEPFHFGSPRLLFVATKPDPARSDSDRHP